MSKFQGLRTRPIENVSKFQGLRTRPIQSEKQSDLELIGKSLASGALSIADLPQNLASLVEAAANPNYGLFGIGRKAINDLRGKPTKDLPSSDYISSIPSVSGKIKEGLKNYAGIDLTPRPNTANQRRLSGASEFAGSLLGGGVLGKFAKGVGAVKTAKFLGAPKTTTEMAKLGALGAGIGGTSAELQELGYEPLTSDIASTLAVPAGVAGIGAIGKGTKNLLSRFSPPNRSVAKQNKLNTNVRNILREKIGEKELPQVLERLEMPSPFGINPTTAELAQNTGLSQLHRATAPTIPAIAEKEALNNSIIRNQLERIAPIGLDPEYTGEKIRNNLFQKLQENKKNRAEITKPLYDKLYALEQGVPLENINNFIAAESKFAKGTKKGVLNKIQSLIQSNQQSQNPLKDFEKNYGYLGKPAQQELKEQLATKPLPAEIKEALEEIGIMTSKAKLAEQSSISNLLMNAKNAIQKDLSTFPEEQIARDAYSKLSVPVSSIEQQPFLKRIVKKDEFNKEFLLAPEKIPTMILSQSPRSVRALISQVGNNKKTMDIIKGSMIDDLLNKTELSSISASGQSNLSYNGIKKYLKKNKVNLDIIFDKEQMKVLDDVKEILRRRNMVSTVGKAAGSDTAANLTVLGALTESASKGLLKQGVQTIPNVGILVRVYDTLSNLFNGKEQQAIKELLEKALVDPKTAKLLLTPIGRIKDEKTFNSILTKIYPTELTVPLLNNINSDEER